MKHTKVGGFSLGASSGGRVIRSVKEMVQMKNSGLWNTHEGAQNIKGIQENWKLKRCHKVVVTWMFLYEDEKISVFMKC